MTLLSEQLYPWAVSVWRSDIWPVFYKENCRLIVNWKGCKNKKSLICEAIENRGQHKFKLLHYPQYDCTFNSTIIPRQTGKSLMIIRFRVIEFSGKSTSYFSLTIWFIFHCSLCNVFAATRNIHNKTNKMMKLMDQGNGLTCFRYFLHNQKHYSFLYVFCKSFETFISKLLWNFWHS